ACFTPMVRPAPCSTPCPYTTLFRSVPALDPLIRPRAHAGYDEQVDAALVAHGMAIEELQCPVYPAGFVAVHPSGHQHAGQGLVRSEEHTSELQSRENLVCRLLLEKK